MTSSSASGNRAAPSRVAPAEGTPGARKGSHGTRSAAVTRLEAVRTLPRSSACRSVLMTSRDCTSVDTARCTRACSAEPAQDCPAQGFQARSPARRASISSRDRVPFASSELTPRLRIPRRVRPVFPLLQASASTPSSTLSPPVIVLDSSTASSEASSRSESPAVFPSAPLPTSIPPSTSASGFPSPSVTPAPFQGSPASSTGSASARKAAARTRQDGLNRVCHHHKSQTDRPRMTCINAPHCRTVWCSSCVNK